MPIPDIMIFRDPNGTPVLDPLEMYKIHDQDVAADPSYFGFMTIDGYWYIMRQNVAEGTFRYAQGYLNYATNWTNRASLDYDYLNLIF